MRYLGFDAFTSEIMRESVKVSVLNHACFTKQESITWIMPSMVTEVSAMFVATTIFLKVKILCNTKVNLFRIGDAL